MSDSSPRTGSGTPAGIRDTEGGPNNDDKGVTPSDSNPRTGSGTPAGIRDTEGATNDPDDKGDEDEGATPSDRRDEDR